MDRVPSFYPLANEASWEKVNLTERKNPHTPVYGVKDFVRPSVTKFDPNFIRTGRAEWAEIIGMIIGHFITCLKS